MQCNQLEVTYHKPPSHSTACCSTTHHAMETTWAEPVTPVYKTSAENALYKGYLVNDSLSDNWWVYIPSADWRGGK